MKKCIITLGILFMLVGTTYGKTVSEDCGCGLGRVAIGEKEGLGWNLLGTFLNGLCGNQTFGMSSGTLECGETTKFAINERINTFVAGNMDSLAMDIASGGGESLSALAEIAQVDPALREPLASELQASFDAIYPDADVSYTHVANALREVFARI